MACPKSRFRPEFSDDLFSFFVLFLSLIYLPFDGIASCNQVQKSRIFRFYFHIFFYPDYFPYRFPFSIEEVRIQVMANRREYEESQAGEFDTISSTLHRGDIVGIEGITGRTKTGELSLVPRRIELLAPCLHTLPQMETFDDPVRFESNLIVFFSRLIFSVRRDRGSLFLFFLEQIHI